MDPLPVVGPLSSTIKSDLSLPLKKFYRGEPLALGITQIFTGIIGIVFGVLIDVYREDIVPYIAIKMPYWSGILYIISGSLAVAAARNPKFPLVRGMLAMNVISAVIAGVGIVCQSFSFSYYFVHYYSSYFCSQFHDESQETLCHENMRHSLAIIRGILSVLFVFTFLEFCIAISVASFGCKLLCRDSYPQMVVVVYNNVTPANAEPPPADCKEPESP